MAEMSAPSRSAHQLLFSPQKVSPRHPPKISHAPFKDQPRIWEPFLTHIGGLSTLWLSPCQNFLLNFQSLLLQTSSQNHQSLSDPYPVQTDWGSPSVVLRQAALTPCANRLEMQTFGPHPGLVNQKLWSLSPAIYILTSSPEIIIYTKIWEWLP